MAIRVVRLGSKRATGEGLRIGTVRRPPRGVKKEDFAKRDFYDVWLPILSPTPQTIKLALAAKTEAEWKKFIRRFRAEMGRPDAAAALNVLAAMSQHANFSIGCYCENESRCHRSVLRDLLSKRGAVIGSD
jgi:uncharacterized protein YeaO (DUF488 family)